MSLILSENVRCQKFAHALWYYHVYIFTLFCCIVVNFPFLSSISAQTNFINIAGKGIHKAVIERAFLKNSPGKLAKALVRAVFFTGGNGGNDGGSKEGERGQPPPPVRPRQSSSYYE